jgi:hypothetical protein
MVRHAQKFVYNPNTSPTDHNEFSIRGAFHDHRSSIGTTTEDRPIDLLGRSQTWTPRSSIAAMRNWTLSTRHLRGIVSSIDSITEKCHSFRGVDKSSILGARVCSQGVVVRIRQ